jgi:hypothetical protein
MVWDYLRSPAKNFHFLQGHGMVDMMGNNDDEW